MTNINWIETSKYFILCYIIDYNLKHIVFVQHEEQNFKVYD